MQILIMSIIILIILILYRVSINIITIITYFINYDFELLLSLIYTLNIPDLF